METQNVFSEYFRNQALGNDGNLHTIERVLQTGWYGFYEGQPWQNGCGIGGLLGSIARRFISFLKPIAKAV